MENKVIDVPAESEPSQALTVRDAVQAVEKAAAPQPSQNKTAQEMRVLEVSEALLPAYQKMGTLELTDQECDALMAPFPDEVVECRPHDGLLFIPHIHVSDRLNKIFKPGKWALVRRREWFDADSSTMFGEYVLVIRGCFVGESVGGHPYVKSNPKVNYSDVLESTAAEALRRICGKRLSCGSQVWNPEYCRQWEAKYRVYERGKYGKRTNGAPTPTLTQPERIEHPRNQAPSKPAQAPQQTRASAPEGEQVFPVCDVLMVAEKSGVKKTTDPKTGLTKEKPWTVWFIKFDDGISNSLEAGTFDSAIASLANDISNEQAKARIVTKPGRKEGSREIVSLERAGDAPPPPSDDQVPFDFDANGNPIGVTP